MFQTPHPTLASPNPRPKMKAPKRDLGSPVSQPPAWVKHFFGVRHFGSGYNVIIVYTCVHLSHEICKLHIRRPIRIYTMAKWGEIPPSYGADGGVTCKMRMADSMALFETTASALDSASGSVLSSEALSTYAKRTPTCQKQSRGKASFVKGLRRLPTKTVCTHAWM